MSGAPTDLQWEDAPRRRRGEEPRRKLTAWVVVAAAVGVAASLALLLTSPRERGEPLDAVPRELAGRWVTTDPRYADREFLIERDRLDLTLDLGPGGGPAILSSRSAPGRSGIAGVIGCTTEQATRPG